MMWSSARGLLAGLRRRLWIAVAVVVLVAAVAVARYAGPGAGARHRYVATQTLVVTVVPPDGGGAFATADARQMERTIALQLTTSAALRDPALDTAIMARFNADGGQVGTVNAQAVAGALTATQDGNRVTLAARWPNPAGAGTLARAATEVLVSDPGLLPDAASANREGGSLRILADGAAIGPALDPGPEVAARARLLETLVLGLFGGAGLALAVDTWMTRREVLAAARQGEREGEGEMGGSSQAAQLKVRG